MLAGLMLRHSIPKHIRSDNGLEFVAKAVREWLSSTSPATIPTSEIASSRDSMYS